MTLLRRKKKPNDKWLFIVSSDENCFVCDKLLDKSMKKIKSKKKLKKIECGGYLDYIFIGKHRDGGNLFRHTECYPGSSKWEKKFHVKHSSLLENSLKIKGENV